MSYRIFCWNSLRLTLFSVKQDQDDEEEEEEEEEGDSKVSFGFHL